ncbi:MAG: four helix bundle protein [Cyclobacteriaceae bacterium]|nr:four helix bundle protein [Cyclobacteriaceae bacterium]
MNNYKELKVWQKSVDLAVKIYESTKTFPREEAYGLTSQIRRSVVSIASNIAEGAGRNSKKDFKNFLAISNGSICELETQLRIANRIDFLNESSFESLQKDITEIQKMNWALQKTLS